MTFFCQPAVLNVGSSQAAVLNVQLKMDVDKMRSLPDEYFDYNLTKLLIARVKGTNLLQSFYVTLKFVDSSAQD